MKPMLLHLYFYLLPAKGRGYNIMKYLLCMCAFFTFLHQPLYLIHL